MREREQKASGRPTSEAEESEMSADTGILGETTTSSSDVPGPKSGRSRFSFSRAKLKGTEHLEEAARKSAESARVNNNHSQSRYIILPSNKNSHNNQHSQQHHHHHHHHHHHNQQQNHLLNQQQQAKQLRSSPTSKSSSPLIDFLTSDEPTSDFSEETHVLIPSPLFPTTSLTTNVPSPRSPGSTSSVKVAAASASLLTTSTSSSSSSTSPPPRPTTRHPGCTGNSGAGSNGDSGSTKGSVDDTTSTTSVTGSLGNNRTSSNSGLNGGGGGGGSGLAQRGSGSGLVNKPPKGWLHPEQLITSIGVTYSVKYIGCLQINTSMRSLDFETRSNIAKECISRVCKASGLPVQEPNRKSDHRILKMLADHPDLDFTGSEVNLSITSASLNLTVIETGEVIAKHEMPNISFASNGDIELMDFVSYVAKDSKHGRACFVLHCVGGSAQDVINTIGQAFELRFKEFLKRAPRPDTKTDLASVEVERDYYNDLPGKVPPDMGSAPSSARMSCNLIPSICSNNSPTASAGDPRSRLPQAAPRNAAAKKAEDRASTASALAAATVDSSDQSNLIDLGSEPPLATESATTSAPAIASASNAAIREYVNYHSSTSPNSTSPPSPSQIASTSIAAAAAATNCATEDEQAKDPFDMKPFNCTLQELSRRRLLGSESESINTHTWFHGTISRKESELLVEKDGDFLVRESIGSPGQFVLTGKQGGLCQHLLLVDPSGIVRTKDLSFESVLHLIRHHRENNLPIVSAESVLHLRNPVSVKGPTV